MLEIDAAFIESAAPNAAAVANGRGLIVKSKFVAYHKSDDGAVLFGECKGSGASNYLCSCDFVQADKPVYRCNCPSRQFPCKHCIGLMFALVEGKPFVEAPLPEDLLSKREKVQTRTEKKVADANKPVVVNKAALAKKIKAQLQGLDLLEQLTHDLVRMGMGNTNAKTARQIEEQAKQLGDSFLTGAQMALRNYTRLFVNQENQVDEEIQPHIRDRIYSEALDQLTRLHSLVKQGRKYLNDRLNDPELAPETETAIAAWLGHAWQLRELKDAGLVEPNVELIQLAFHSRDDIARKEFVDCGIWMNLSSGKIQLTQTYRPYQAAKFIKSEDSFFKIAVIPELYVYPGDVNRRVRWEASTARNIEPRDLQCIAKHASDDLASLIKEIKNHMKSPLADKQPVVAFNYARIGQLEDGSMIVEDKQGTRLIFTEIGAFEEPPSCQLLGLLPSALHTNQTLIARFHQDIDAGSLRVKPLSIVSGSQVFRLTL